ncbi:MAG: 4Fe-4S binding protein [Bryobacterales bacterium]|nr:4Fe-4S binding protein [Bryobacterales bacterium]
MGTQKKMLIRRTSPDVSQIVRRTVQGLFFLLNLWIGTQFFFFVRGMESGNGGWGRPAGVEGWLPIAGMMNTKYFLLTGEVPGVHPAAMFLFVAFVGMSLLLRKAFCGWLCPVGAVSEQLWKLGRDTFRGNFALPKWIDIPLRGVKYLLLGFFAYAVAGMDASDLRAFLYSPYGVIADVKMLDFFRNLSVTAAIVLIVLVVASVFVRNFWCRYLCPYGALMGLVSLLSPLRIRRNEERCIDCAKCAKACPANLPVDTLVQIRSAECIGCLECVAVCPAEGALAMNAPRRREVAPWVMAAAIAVLFFGIVGFAKISGHWEGTVPEMVYRRLIPSLAEMGHP